MREQLSIPQPGEQDGRGRGRAAVTRQIKPFSWQMDSTGWFLVDFSVAYLSAWLAHWLVPQGAGAIDPLRAGIILGAVVGVTGHVLGLHDTHHERREWKVLVKIGLVLGAGAVVLAFLSAGLVTTATGRGYLAVCAVLSAAAMAILRSLAWQFVSVNRHRVCVIGDPAFCERGADFLRAHDGVKPLDVVGLEVSPELSAAGGGAEGLEIRAGDGGDCFVLDAGLPAEGERFDLERWAERRGLDEIVVQGYSMPLLGGALLACMDSGIRVSSFNEFVETNYRFVPVDEIDHSWFLASRAGALGVFYQTFKRGLEVTVALLGMLLALPLVTAAAVAIRASGSGPVFYSQIRVGLRNRPFRIYKLRTMCADAESDGAKWARRGDDRVTRVGLMLRKTRMDEVPQFWNILRGDMAFIGPRPERPEFVRALAEEVPFFNQRHLVKPGLTGWAQINCAYAASTEDSAVKLKYDLYYIKHANLKLDLHILVRTIGAIMKGAR